MKWQSIEHFLAMGGYGLYVWGSYGMTVVVALVEILLLRRRMRAARRLVADARVMPER
ncbi:MAG: heme exporter protein CcmD [Burkholderiales bacterium]